MPNKNKHAYQQVFVSNENANNTNAWILGFHLHHTYCLKNSFQIALHQ